MSLGSIVQWIGHAPAKGVMQVRFPLGPILLLTHWFVLYSNTCQANKADVFVLSNFERFLLFRLRDLLPFSGTPSDTNQKENNSRDQLAVVKVAEIYGTSVSSMQ